MDEAGDGGGGAPGAVGEEFFEDGVLGGGEGAGGEPRAGGGEFGEVHELGGHGADREAGGDEVVEEFLQAEGREGRRAAENQHSRERGMLPNSAGASRSGKVMSGRHKTRAAEKAVDHSRGVFEMGALLPNAD